MNEHKRNLIFSPFSNKKLYSTFEIGKIYGLSESLIYEYLIKEGYLNLTEDKIPSFKDNTFGEVLWIEKGAKPTPTQTKTTKTQIPLIRLTKKGCNILDKAFLDLGMRSTYFDFNELSKYFPDGQYSFSYRNKENIKSEYDKIYINKRDTSLTRRFSNRYLYISDEDYAMIKNLIDDYNKKNGIKEFPFRLDVKEQTKEIVDNILNWRKDYISNLSKNLKTTLTDEEVDENFDILTNYLDNKR